MTKDTNGTNKRNLLKYREGEQIIKQGDYGISIYKVMSGKVQVFRESRGMEVPLATLEIGEMIGEMVFLKKDAEIRSASIRALEDTELEVWHPRELIEKYEQTPLVLKIIIDQALGRLDRMNRLMDKLAVKIPKEKSKSEQKKHPLISRRKFYRKDVNIACKYAPSDQPKGFHTFLKGHIKDISMTGLSIEVSPKNETIVSHKVGDSFHVDAVLPNGQALSATVEIVFVQKKPGKVRLGLKFEDLPYYYGMRKTLGFFLMP